MSNSVQQELVRAENEIRALKTAVRLAYSSTMYPENNPTINWTGDVSFSTSATDGVLARIKIRFTRSDEIETPPLVDFAWNYSTNPTYVDYVRQYMGTVLTGDDPDITLFTAIHGHESATGAGYVEYTIEVWSLIMQYFEQLNSINVTLNIQAISPVAGTLSVERVK